MPAASSVPIMFIGAASSGSGCKVVFAISSRKICSAFLADVLPIIKSVAANSCSNLVKCFIAADSMSVKLFSPGQPKVWRILVNISYW